MKIAFFIAGVFFATHSFAQISIDSVMYYAVNRHILEFKDAVKNYSQGRLYVILGPMQATSSKDTFTINSVKINLMDYDGWKKKDIQKSKVIVKVSNYVFCENGIDFSVIGGVVTFNKRQKLVQIFSRNIVEVRYKCDANRWIYQCR